MSFSLRDPMIDKTVRTRNLNATQMDPRASDFSAKKIGHVVLKGVNNIIDFKLYFILTKPYAF